MDPKGGGRGQCSGGPPVHRRWMKRGRYAFGNEGAIYVKATENVSFEYHTFTRLARESVQL